MSFDTVDCKCTNLLNPFRFRDGVILKKMHIHLWATTIYALSFLCSLHSFVWSTFRFKNNCITYWHSERFHCADKKNDNFSFPDSFTLFCPLRFRSVSKLICKIFGSIVLMFTEANIFFSSVSLLFSSFFFWSLRLGVYTHGDLREMTVPKLLGRLGLAGRIINSTPHQHLRNPQPTRRARLKLRCSLAFVSSLFLAFVCVFILLRLLFLSIDFGRFMSIEHICRPDFHNFIGKSYIKILQTLVLSCYFDIILPYW